MLSGDYMDKIQKLFKKAERDVEKKEKIPFHVIFEREKKRIEQLRQKMT